MSVVYCLLWTLFTAVQLVNAGIRCDCSINGVTYNLVGINCARPNTTERIHKGVQCDKASYGAVERGYGENPGEKEGGYRALYRLYRTGRPWQDAAESCWRDGGHLAVPSSQEEIAFLAGLLRRQGGGRHTAAAVGVRRAADLQPYEAVTGEEVLDLISVNWPAGTPYSVAGQQCLELQVDAKDWEAFRSRDCSAPAAYFCERPLPAVVKPSYRFVKGFGFYMPSGLSLSYSRSEQLCQKSGGHIVVPETQQEADMLVRAFDEFPTVEQIYVGIHDRRQAGVFETIHGGRLDWLEFQNWAPGALESRSADVHCVAFSSGGSYQLVPCDTPLPTICEWKLS